MKNRDRKRRAMEGVYAAPEYLTRNRSIPSGTYPQLHAQPDSPQREMEDVYGCPEPMEPCDLDESIRYCPACGNPNNASNNFCIHCGARLTGPVRSKRPLSEMVCVYASPQVMDRRYARGGMGNGRPGKK